MSKPDPNEKWELKECATLGDQWKDIYRNGCLFMREVESEMAEAFIASPTLYNFPFIDVPKMRTYMLEREHHLHKCHHPGNSKGN